METIKQIADKISNDFYKSNIDSPRLDARLIIAHALNIQAKKVLLYPEREVNKNQEDKIYQFAQQRKDGKPVSRIIGKRDFWDLSFELSTKTLDPRADTETLIEAVLQNEKKDKIKNILDLGTGTGCILLALLNEIKCAKGIGVDIEDDAVLTAIKNAKNNKLDDRSEFIKKSWNEPDFCSFFNNKFDIIASNPPYISKQDYKTLEIEVKNYDPKTALVAKKDGLLEYENIAKKALQLLKNDGMIFLEIGQGQEKEVIEIFEKQGFKFKGYKKDLSGIIRCLFFAL